IWPSMVSGTTFCGGVTVWAPRGCRPATRTSRKSLMLPLSRPLHETANQGVTPMPSRIRLALIAAASVSAIALAAPAAAQLLSHKDVSASIAMTIVRTTIETCKANGYAVSATVVGRNGEIIVQVRGDDTAPHTIENSFRKAYTARTFRSPSGALV